jgi:hypothetical protein
MNVAYHVDRILAILLREKCTATAKKNVMVELVR